MKKNWNITFPYWTAPLALLALVFAGFGLLAPRLGFYWDDWAQLLAGQLYGVDRYWRYFAFDRPTSAWTHALVMPLLGAKPVHWQVFTLSLRWLTAVAVWWTLSSVWQHHRRQATFVALLFAVYPVFTQQQISLAYHQHWLQYLLYWLSLGGMVQAVRQRRYRLPFSLLSLTTMLLHLSITEFFLGAEMLRPALLWLALAQDETLYPARLKSTLRRWLPYALILLAYLVWRFVLMPFSNGDPHSLALFERIAAQPGAALFDLFKRSVGDTLYIVLGNWSNVIDLDLVNFQRPSTWFSWLAGIAVLAGMLMYLNRARFAPSSPEEDERWSRQAALLGAAAVVMSTLPIWVVDDAILLFLDPDHADRFALVAMVGASLLWVAYLEWAVKRAGHKYFVLCLTLALAVGFHLRNANEYRWRWEEQKNFYWQLVWRAPAIQPQTAILTEEIPFAYQGLFSTSAAINLLYPQPTAPERLAYWMYSLIPGRIHSQPGSIDFHTQMRMFYFEARAANAVLVQPVFQMSNCIWVLSKNDGENPYLSPLTKGWLSVSNLGRIGAQPIRSDYPPAEIFGDPPQQTWCYYFQKADLARQMQDWQQVINLGNQAQAQGYRPTANSANSPHEWMPFIEGYAHSGQWQEAISLSSDAYHLDRNYQQQLCAVWQRIDESAPAKADKDEALAEARQRLACDQATH